LIEVFFVGSSFDTTFLAHSLFFHTDPFRLTLYLKLLLNVGSGCAMDAWAKPDDQHALRPIGIMEQHGIHLLPIFGRRLFAVDTAL